MTAKPRRPGGMQLPCPRGAGGVFGGSSGPKKRPEAICGLLLEQGVWGLLAPNGNVPGSRLGDRTVDEVGNLPGQSSFNSGLTGHVGATLQLSTTPRFAWPVLFSPP